MAELEIKNLSKKYDGFEMSDVTFKIPRGTIVGLIGENGAGKSTLIKAVIGAVHPDGGEILLDGKPIELLTREEKQEISVVLDDTGLPMEINLKVLNAIMKRLFVKWDKNRFSELIGQLELPQDKPIKDFSKGMKMKAAIAVALARESELLVLDEPTSGLDPVVRDEILGLIYDYVQNENKSVLISSHITSDLEKMCDHIVYIHKGRVLLSEEKDVMTEKYIVYSCDEKTLGELDRNRVERFIRREYGVDVLAYKVNLPKGFEGRRVSLDDIMLFYSKGEVL